MPELFQNTDEKDEIYEANRINIRNKRAKRKQKHRKNNQYAKAKEWHSRGWRFDLAEVLIKKVRGFIENPRTFYGIRLFTNASIIFLVGSARLLL